MGTDSTAIPRFIPQLFRPGQTIEQPLPGDFLLTHANAWTSQLIRLGEAVRYRGSRRKFAHWSHSALFIGTDGEIIEALGGGVQQRNVSVYKDTEYLVIRLNQVPDAERRHEVEFACHCLHQHYGFLTILSLLITLFTASKFVFGVDGQKICSGLVAQALERTGEIFQYDSWHMMPADLAEHFKVTPASDSISAKGIIPPRDLGVTQRSH
jgi:hypothetical protein